LWSNYGEATFRVDLNPPSSPGAPLPDQQRSKPAVPQVSYNVSWDHALDNASAVESGVLKYELQERMDTSPVWKTVDYVSGSENTYFFENKPPGHFFYYRIRAQDNAGNWGEWSEVSGAAITGLPKEAVSNVSNYPNPVRFDKGHEKTIITYILKEDADVDVYLYDMMGYLVKKWNFRKGKKGGVAGENHFEWFGLNEVGASVAKGGYLMRIVVHSSEGTVEKTRKIGIIK